MRKLGWAILNEWLLITLICVGVASLVSASGSLYRIENIFYDFAMSSKSPQPDKDILIIAVDEKSLLQIGHWPWGRVVHANLVERLTAAGSGPIGMDLMFNEPDDASADGDNLLAEAVANHGRVVLPILAADSVDERHRLRPLPELVRAGALIGHGHVHPNRDGVVRNVDLWEKIGDNVYPQFALALLQLVSPTLASAYSYSEKINTPAWAKEIKLLIPFSGGTGSYRQVSYIDMLRGKVPDQDIRGKIILIGMTSQSTTNLLPTPTAGYDKSMSSAELQANVFSALRNQQSIFALPRSVQALLCGAYVVILLLLIVSMSPRRALFTALIGALISLFIAWVLLIYFNIWIAPVGAFVGCFIAYPVWSWRRLEVAQRYLDDELELLSLEGRPWSTVAAQPTVADRFDPLRARIAQVREATSRERNLRRFINDTLESLPVGVFVSDHHSQIIFSNRHLHRMLGVTRGEELHSAMELVSWPREVVLRRGLPVPPEFGVAVSIEISSRLGNQLLVSVSGLYDRRGMLMGTVFGFNDVTALREAHRVREETMHYLSHDLRSPLASIVSLSDDSKLISALPPSEAAMLGRIKRNARNALELTDNLLRLVRAEAMDAKQFELLDLRIIAHEAADEMWAVANNKGIHILYKESLGNEPEMLIEADRSLLRRAIVNLLNNAVKYSEEKTRVKMHLERDGTYWRLDVIDSGCGIDPDQLPKLFKRFAVFRDQGDRRFPGVGLGLMLVKTVADRLGGKVIVRSKLTKGSTFSLYLPVAEEEESWTEPAQRREAI